MVIQKISFRNGWLVMLALVMSSNFILYQTTFGVNLLPEQPNSVVLGSIFDLAIVAPTLFLVWKQKWGWKYVVSSIALGLIVVRFLIPMDYLAPFETLTLLGFTIEGLLVLLEILILVTLIKYLPSIIRSVKKSPLPTPFAFSCAVENRVKDVPIIRVICSELLMFYYAFASWKQKPQQNEHTFTIHKKSSYMAVQLMLIHAILLETVAIHFWLYGKSLILSLILLLLNIYAIILLVADMQALRLNPLRVTKDGMFISMGLMKRMELKWTEIEEIIDDPDVLKKKAAKGTIEFIARDFEQVGPDLLITLKEPVEAIWIMGIKKKYNHVALRIDDPSTFKEMVMNRI